MVEIGTERYLNTREAAEYLGVTPGGLRYILEKHDIERFSCTTNRNWALVRVSDLDGILEERRGRPAVRHLEALVAAEPSSHNVVDFRPRIEEPETHQSMMHKAIERVDWKDEERVQVFMAVLNSFIAMDIEYARNSAAARAMWERQNVN